MLVQAASITVYDNYGQYLTHKGTKYEVLKEVAPALGKYRLVVRKSGQFVKIKCEDIWGFTYDDGLYRTLKNGQYVKLVSQGKLFYFENGEAYLSDGEFMKGHYNYLSKTLDGDLIPMPTPDSNASVSKGYEKFKQDYPEYEKFYQCFDKNHDLETCRDCIDRFENPDKKRIFDALKDN